MFPVYGPRDAVHPVGAAVGPGLPMGIGTALAGGGRTDLAETVARAVATPGPSLVEVDMGAIGAFPPYAPYNTMGIYAHKAAQ